MSKEAASSLERRSFLGRLNAGAAALAAMFGHGVANAQVRPAATGRWEPLRHEKDDWLEQLPGKHRLVFDTTNPEGIGLALLFTNNFMRVNRSDYGLQNSDLAVVIVVRHRSAPFGYNDAMWAKYSAAIAAHVHYEDPKSKAAPKVNVYNSGDYGDLAPNRGTTFEALAKQGVQFAVCANATRAVAGAITRSVGGNTDAVFTELTANLVPNGRMVPAGIVAVNRAQERGYSLVSA
jgi:intracellular sulfur oxidation DsrE/DsrF family protein